MFIHLLSFPIFICSSCIVSHRAVPATCTGKDGSIAEYEVEKVSPAKGLRLLSLHSLASQTAVTSGPSPTALTFAPPLPYFAQGSADLLLLVADEAHKLRIYNADTHTCVSTAVGPLHGGHIISCRVFRCV